ncbi:MAG TPA: acetyl/propionyl/methylcrotonyl-CoA carboxylase subunit alpha [Stellaceae bacterium]|nr:acetyl/propionyl/methylcrotonyl-CoA carboxylase subunit alpha [Stellaceae bacterium]
MFKRILIANRGEIACRIARTARRLGIETVAVYSEADRGALHVEVADEAVPIGPPAASESYLAIDRIVAAARATGSEAIHPGYGFLAENPGFAEACERAGLVFIGPSATAIRAMGDKSAAKALMERTGVPLVPGYHEADQSSARLADEARRIGYPVLIKPSAGGGGKGMRVVIAPDQLAAELATAQREARSAFGNDRVLIEKYLTKPRHIEVQVFADRHGNVVHLFERDCSIQRRMQKVIEEAPAIGLGDARRREMGDTATAAARAVGYVGAGTVEFIVEGDAFYFMEMNTRLQVEHPVTEMITGLDLVEWQLRVAAGEPLPLRQEAILRRGHAVEARLYAEDPRHNFLPATGFLTTLRPPAEVAGVRVDTGVREGDRITIYYDPLIAKLIVWGEDRGTAVRRLAAALAEYRVAGLVTNREFLARLASHPAFERGAIDTGFIDRFHEDLIPQEEPAPLAALAAASLDRVLAQQIEAAHAQGGDPWSPWRRRDGWRLNGATYQDLRWRDGEKERHLRLHYRREGYRIEADGRDIAAQVRRVGDHLVVGLDGHEIRAAVLSDGDDAVTVQIEGIEHRLRYIDPTAPTLGAEEQSGSLTAPMPGRVVEVKVKQGAKVARGTALLVLEAMKMEHTIAAPADGVVERINYAVGDLVEEGAALIEFAAEEVSDAASG